MKINNLLTKKENLLYFFYLREYTLEQKKICLQNKNHPYFRLLSKHINEINKIFKHPNENKIGQFNRRAIKYLDILESYRLVKYQYSKYSTLKKSFTESVYSGVVLDILRYMASSQNKQLKIADIGCGPSRITYELLDFFPQATFDLFDFSITNLFFANKLLCEGTNVEIPIRVLSDFSSKKSRDIEIIKIKGKKSTNVNLNLCDLESDSPLKEKYDLIVAINSINLIDSPDLFIEKVISKLNKKGILVISDLMGWKEDRAISRRIFSDGKSFYDFFAKRKDVKLLSYWYGGPYCEEFNSERYDNYISHTVFLKKI
ncbi:MAG: class I SAM-dependent methyltransferase [Nanoarchaeota archaeon]|nr:class I SAM-dependent methyltransferase [Nanoarchaeota archaeon]